MSLTGLLSCCCGLPAIGSDLLSRSRVLPASCSPDIDGVERSLLRLALGVRCPHPTSGARSSREAARAVCGLIPSLTPSSEFPALLSSGAMVRQPQAVTLHYRLPLSMLPAIRVDDPDAILPKTQRRRSAADDFPGSLSPDYPSARTFFERSSCQADHWASP